MRRPDRWEASRDTLVRVAPFLVLLAVSLLIHWTYLVEPGRPFFVDSNIPLSYGDVVRTYFDVWNPNESHNAFAQYMRIPYMLPLYLAFRTLGLGFNAFVEFLFWFPTFLGMAAAYVFFDRMLPERGSRRQFVGVCLLLSVFYALNPWITKHFYQYFFRVGFAFFPLALLYFIEYVQRGRRYRLILASIFALMTAMSPHGLLFFFATAGLYALFHGTLRGNLATAIGRTAKVAGGFVLLAAHWLVPFLYQKLAGGSARGYNVGQWVVELYSARNTALNLFANTGGYWPGRTEATWWTYDPLWFFQIVFLAIPIVAFAAYLSWPRDDRMGLYSGVTILLVLPIASGFTYFGPVYDVIVGLPMHEVLRAPDRWLSILPLLYGYLMGRTMLAGDSRRIRLGAVALTGVVCLVLVLLNAYLFATALGPTAMPADYEHAELEDYEDVFIFPPQPTGGYRPSWLSSPEGGIVDSYDANLYGFPDSQKEVFSYYVVELIDQNRTEAAVNVLHKTGANTVMVRTDVEQSRGVPPSNETIAELDEHPGVTREYTGEHMVVYDIEDSRGSFRVVRPVRVRRDLDVARSFVNDSKVYPYFRPRNASGRSLLDQVDGRDWFHPSNMYRRINQRDVLARPPTYEGVAVQEKDRFLPPESNGSLVIQATPVGMGSEVVRDTATGREIFEFQDGNERVRIDLEGDGRPLTINGPLYIDRLYVSQEDIVEASMPVDTSFHSVGTITPNATRLDVEGSRLPVTVSFRNSADSGFWQTSFATARPIEGPFTVDISATAYTRNEFGIIVLTESGETKLLGPGQRFHRGRQNVTFHVPDLESNVTRVQFAVFPREDPTQGRLTVHEFEVRERPPVPRTPVGRPKCDVDPAAPRCEGAAEITSVERQSPTRYVLTVDADNPYTLAFADSYDPMWTAEVTGPNGTTTHASKPMYTVTNGFWIDRTGEQTVVVHYRQRQWFEYGVILSGLALLVAAALLILDWYRGVLPGEPAEADEGVGVSDSALPTTWAYDETIDRVLHLALVSGIALLGIAAALVLVRQQWLANYVAMAVYVLFLGAVSIRVAMVASIPDR